MYLYDDRCTAIKISTRKLYGKHWLSFDVDFVHLKFATCAASRHLFSAYCISIRDSLSVLRNVTCSDHRWTWTGSNSSSFFIDFRCSDTRNNFSCCSRDTKMSAIVRPEISKRKFSREKKRPFAWKFMTFFPLQLQISCNFDDRINRSRVAAKKWSLSSFLNRLARLHNFHQGF